MMFQSYALFPHMSVEKNIAYGLKQDKISKLQINKQVARMLEMVELSHLAKRKPHELSGGQRQRVALARSLAKEPKVLLLDEPLGALDRKLRKRTQLELVDIQEDVGITFVFVTHDQEEAMTMGSRISVMNQGEILQIGSPNEMYEYPKSKFVANFLGEVNLLSGKLLDDQLSSAVIAVDQLGIDLRLDRAVNGRVGSSIDLAIRPEKVILDKKPISGKNVVQGTVRDIVYTGSTNTYHIKLASDYIIQAETNNSSRDESFNITWEDKVYVQIKQENCVVLSG